MWCGRETGAREQCVCDLGDTANFETGNLKEKPRCRAANAVDRGIAGRLRAVSLLSHGHHQNPTRPATSRNYSILENGGKCRMRWAGLTSATIAATSAICTRPSPTGTIAYSCSATLSDIRYLRERKRIEGQRAVTLAAMAAEKRRRRSDKARPRCQSPPDGENRDCRRFPRVHGSAAQLLSSTTSKPIFARRRPSGRGNRRQASPVRPID